MQIQNFLNTHFFMMMNIQNVSVRTDVPRLTSTAAIGIEGINALTTNTHTHANKQSSVDSHSGPKSISLSCCLIYFCSQLGSVVFFLYRLSSVQFSNCCRAEWRLTTHQHSRKWSLMSGLLMDECLVINIHVYYYLALALNTCIYININIEATWKHLPGQMQLSVNEQSL